MLECSVLASEAEIGSIADEWRQLQARIGRNPYTGCDWVHIWWRTVGYDQGARNLRVITGRRDGRLVAVLPLAVARRRGVRILQAVGHGADPCDILCDEPAHATELWNFARRNLAYDVAEIRNVYPESMCHEALSSFARPRDRIDAFSLRLDWPTSADWLASLPSQMKRRVRALEKKGTVRFEICRQEPLPEAIIDGMIKQKIAWSTERGKEGVFSHPSVYEYFHQWLKAAAREGRLFLAWLKCGEDVIAYSQSFTYQGLFQNYFTTYDPAWSWYSPGLIILRHSICWAIDNGFQVFDHMQGGGNYKSGYSNDIRPCASFAFSGSLKGRLVGGAYMTARTLWRTIKKNAEHLPFREKQHAAPVS